MAHRATQLACAPTVNAPIVRVVRDQGGENQAGLLHWELIAPWENGIAGKYSTINARIETFRTAASYRNAWIERTALSRVPRRLL